MNSQSTNDPVVERFVSLLAAHGFSVTNQEGPDERAFGNMLIDACSGDLCIRLVRDRGQWTVDLKDAKSADWSYIAHVRDVLEERAMWPIECQFDFLDKHFDEIRSAFGPELVGDTKRRLKRRRKGPA